jgi:hypothetical protein
MKNIMAYQVYLNKGQSDYRTSLTLLGQREIDFDIDEIDEEFITNTIPILKSFKEYVEQLITF